MAFKTLESLDFFKELESLCDEIWAEVQDWAWFEKKTVGAQLVRAFDSVGANIVEGEGRWSGRDQLRHLHIAHRGSLQEARWWLIRAKNRGLFHRKKPEEYIAALESIHRRFNKLITYRRKTLAS